jgi:hypothetical protein
MCYKSPGPRCSYHAKKQLIKAKAELKETGSSKGMDEYLRLKENVAKAELDFDSTPAGMAAIKLRIERGEDRRGDMKARLDYCQANRNAMLAAIKAVDTGDIDDHENIEPCRIGTGEFEDGMREGWSTRNNRDELIAQYTRNGERLAKSLNSDENAAMFWYSSDGFSHINAHLHEKNGTYIDEGKVRRYTKKKITAAIKSMDSTFAKNRLEDPVVVYRGMNLHNYPESVQDNAMKGDSYLDKYKNHVEKEYTEGSVHTFPSYLSTSADPAKARSFAQSNVIMEIKTKSAVALGFISSWESEREMLVERNKKFKVVSVKHDVPYDNARNPGNEKGFTIIQLEEID